jgi:hypothetical protein
VSVSESYEDSVPRLASIPRIFCTYYLRDELYRACLVMIIFCENGEDRERVDAST